MLLTMKELLDKSKDADFAVGAFNATELALFRAVVEQAEESNSPAIIQASTGEFNFVALKAKTALNFKLHTLIL